MPPLSSPATPQRRRRTVQFDNERFAARIEEALAAELRALAAGAPRWMDRPADGGAPVRETALRQLLALLRAFCDAALPAGGLPLDRTGGPRDLAALRAAARRLARAGDTAPKALDKIRAGRPVDLRIAVALLHALRFALGQPRLQLPDIGGLESERLRLARRIEHALQAAAHDLPASVATALQRRAAETAGYTYLMDEVQVHYGALQMEVDALGLRRLRLQRTIRYVPLRLAGFQGRLAPARTYEWHHWNRIGEARLEVQVLNTPAADGVGDGAGDGSDGGAGVGARVLGDGRADRHGADGPDDGAAESGRDRVAEGVAEGVAAGTADGWAIELPLARRLLPDQGVFVIEVDPAADPALLQRLVLPAAGHPGPLLAVQWREELRLHVADSDGLAWPAPLSGLSIEFEPGLADRLEIAVGDSPGLQRTDRGWRLDRSLMPRELVTVRLRLRGLDPSLPMRLGAGGECPAATGAGEASATPATPHASASSASSAAPPAPG